MDPAPGSTPSLETEFRGTERFRVVRRLGAGGMGVVYEADDVKRGRRVALKTIKHPDVELLYRLKREFRALADLSHPNLIELYDLVIEEGVCFFTMELVRGRDFVAYCRGGSESEGVRGTHAGRRDEVRLRAALPQLAEGLRAIHAAGKVHRDIKPSNVLVTDEGRVVLLDFGVAADTGRSSLDTLESSTTSLTGTAEYMAPEQASSGGAPTPACDWYGVGVLLYETLTGRLPFAGSLFEILIAKNRDDPPTPRGVVADVPADLDRLCLDLLARDPADRPGGEEILARLAAAASLDPERGGSSDAHAGAGASIAAAATPAPFAGRERELEALAQSYAVLEAGRASIALVLGPSGIGKSTLVREFLDRLRGRRADVVVLEGRCYERELVPFRAMDGLIDHLSHYWRRLPSAEASALLPRDAAALPRLFPVLARVPSVAEAPAAHGTLDPKETRTRAFQALREMLHRLSDRHPLVLVLDDMQWVDTGTVTLLTELMRPPDPPRLLLLLSARDGAAPVLERLSAEMAADLRRVDVGPLPESEAQALAQSLLHDQPPEVARRVAMEAEGSPYFLGELARYVRSSGIEDVGAVRLEQVLNERIERLTVASRRLLEVVSVAGEPLDPPLAGAAAAVGADELPREVGSLRAGHLLRAAVGGGDALLEPYHDRIRQCVLGGLAEKRMRRHHEALAMALEGQGSAERLARHWAGAGDPRKAARYAHAAADEALATHHFDHAADLFRTALDLGGSEGDERRALLERLGDALQNAGRCAESGDAYLAASEGAAPEAFLACHSRAAEQFLVSGHVQKGLLSLATVLEGIGVEIPRTPRRALASVVWHRLRLKLRGFSWTPRDAATIPPADLARLDAFMAAATGLGLVDNIRGADFQTRGLLLALKTGERRRVGRSIALESVYRASQGTKGRAKAQSLIAAAARIAAESKDPYLVGWVGLAENFSIYSGGDFHASAEGFLKAEALFRSETTGTTLEINSARVFGLQAMRYGGDWARLSPLFDEWLRDARRRGDRYAETTLVRAFNGVWLARDDVEGARKALADASWEPPEGAFHLQHWYGLRARGEIALCDGSASGGGSPVEALLADFDRLDRSMLTRVQIIRTESLWLRGRLLLAAAAGGGALPRASIAAFAKRLDADRVSHATVWALLLRAGAASLAGDPAAAAATFRDAAARADGHTMPLVAAVARLRAADSPDSATAWMRSHGVARPDRMAAVIAPS